MNEKEKSSILSPIEKAIFVIHKCLSRFENQYQDFRIFFSFIFKIKDLWIYVLLIFKLFLVFHFSDSEETGNPPYSDHFIPTPSTFLLFVLAFRISGHFCLVFHVFV